MDAYRALVAEAEQDYEGFWGRLARENLQWQTPFTKVLDDANAPFYKWFDDGKLNVSYNCLDIHLHNGNVDKVAIIFETDSGDVSKVTYRELHKKVCQFANGYLFDGFPRTLPQAEMMKKAGVGIDYVLEIDVPDEAILERMSGRRIHPSSGRSYHVKFNPPKIEEKDDMTGENLILRDDDREYTVRKRLRVYHDQTEMLIAYYTQWAQSGQPGAAKYRKIDGIGPVDVIRANAFAAIAR
ncbi:nucleoside monophosphate kinase [Collimonas silvisoli]|uniref:nucleoside monophosphate kinase n=1 Tax=Collimonas silvisoli TaxID=2825884 RepID=UPI001B8C5CAF|nr:nucleoside monophosphate kinase [Collimonas silvisoli]